MHTVKKYGQKHLQTYIWKFETMGVKKRKWIYDFGAIAHEVKIYLFGYGILTKFNSKIIVKLYIQFVTHFV